MSEVRVNNIVDFGGKGAPTFDNGAVISGVSSLGNQAKIGGNVTITSGGINVSGVTTAATLSGNLTGDVNAGFLTATSTVIGSGVTINAGGLNITGVVTATTFTGDGSTMTGVAMTITPLAYNPDVYDSTVPKATGIGITFDHRILAGSGNVTLSIATNAGAAGTTVENFGVGSSVTIAGRKATIDPTSDLTAGETYHISYPSGAFTNTGGDVSYVGTAYTFGVKPEFAALLVAGRNDVGGLAQNNTNHYSSPVQIPGITWSTEFCNGESSHAIKTDGTLWGWGDGYWGTIGVNNQVKYSSPVQIPGTTWSKVNNYGGLFTAAIKTDGTLWAWGHNGGAQLGQNNTDHYSSPRQIPGTTWKDVSPQYRACMAIKTDGTLWGWGGNNGGQLGLNNATYCSSPIQIPGTSWNTLGTGDYNGCCVRTDGTLWVWGHGSSGALAQNNQTNYSSPKQIPGTNWVKCESFRYGAYATKTDGTLWAWGQNTGGYEGALGQNNTISYSSPVQIPGTNWHTTRWNAGSGWQNIVATKTDGTLWAWGVNEYGGLAQNNVVSYSSPVQVPGTSWTAVSRGVEMYGIMAIGTI